MSIKFIATTAAILALTANFALAHQAEKATSDVAASAKAKKGYIHKPDSTMYHPGNGVAKAKKAMPAAAGKKYIHRPDSTQYHPSNKK